METAERPGECVPIAAGIRKFLADNSCQNNLKSNRQRLTNAGENMEEGELQYTVGGNVNWWHLLRNSMEIS